MVSSTGIPAFSSEWINRPLFFARQPEPDLEFTDEDLDEAVPPPTPPRNAPKRSGTRPLLWILLLLAVGGVGYLALDPDGAMQLIESYLDDDRESAQPAPRTPSSSAQAPTVISPEVIEKDSSLSQTTAPASPVIAAPAVRSAPAFVNVTGPRFSEGQRVTAIPDPSRPQSPVPLFTDAVGTKTGTTVQAGATLTVLDGDYQKTGWVYAVRTEDGRKGWIMERRLQPTR